MDKGNEGNREITISTEENQILGPGEFAIIARKKEKFKSQHEFIYWVIVRSLR